MTDTEELTESDRAWLLVVTAPVGVTEQQIATQRIVAKLLRIHDAQKSRIDELEDELSMAESEQQQAERILREHDTWESAARSMDLRITDLLEMAEGWIEHDDSCLSSGLRHAVLCVLIGEEAANARRDELQG